MDMEIPLLMKKFIYLVLALPFLSCDEDNGGNPLVSGKIDLTTTVALGNSLTAGIVSGGWTYEGITSSYPALIMKSLGGDGRVGDGSSKEDFIVPGIPDPGTILPLQVATSGNAGTYINGDPVFRYTTTGGGIDLSRLVANNVSLTNPFNNLAVPGATARDIAAELTGVTATYGTPPFGNPLFSMVLRNKGTAINQAVSKNPTFAFFWAGNNEVLSSALSGGVSAVFPLNDEGTVRGFISYHREVMDALLETEAKIVTATIPNVLAIPAVSMVGKVYFRNERAYIADLDGDTIYSDTLAFWGTDDGVTRKLRGSERVMMRWLGSEPETNGGRLFGLSQSDPLPDNYWISDSEISTLLDVIAKYNEYILSWRTNDRVAVVDMYSLFQNLAEKDGENYTINGVTFKVDLSLPFGGFFSLDGIHPALNGQRVLANAFISEINQKFDASIPAISISETEKIKPAVLSAGLYNGLPASAPFEQWLHLLGIQ